MQFSVIYSVDVPNDIEVLNFAPPKAEELWDETEGDEEFGYGYLDGIWEGGHHRKWCFDLGLVKNLKPFVEHCVPVGREHRNHGQPRCSRLRFWLGSGHRI